jgi:transposase
MGLVKFRTLLTWGDEILAFHDADRVTNGPLEGTNNKLGVLKGIAFGFTNAVHFGHRALLIMPAVTSSP